MRIIFIADFFIDELIGGAELSIQTHINSCPYEYVKIKSNLVDLNKLNKKNDFLILGNFAHLPTRYLFELRNGWRYVVEECDYKYCEYRSKHKHEAITGYPCQCEKYSGLIIRDFYLSAKHLFWKSEGQRDEYYRLFPELQNIPSNIMGGVFSNEDLDYLLSLKNIKRDNKYFILKSNSWIKGYGDALAYCKENKLPCRIVGNIPYRKAIKEMARSKGIVYLPKGFDVSCRMITEAKLLGIDIRTNDLVQHTREAWFNAGEAEMLKFLRSRDKEFWQVIDGYLNQSS